MRPRRLKPVDTWRQRLLRQLTLWIALACGFAQLSASAHDLLVEHVRCAEHGEWVHAAHQHADAWAGARSQVDHEGVKSVVPERGAESREAHEHCLLWSDRHNPALVPSAALVDEVGIGKATALAAPTPSSFFGEVYSFAPKTSPPVSNRLS